ncbi:MAG TPA: MFS transporter [Pseudonocardiaceae bacterium]|jgi:MFS family permease|nr:MFS transporter [Pseudonocardiaceae bacterium]
MPAGTPIVGHEARLGPRGLLAVPDFRRLLLSRFAAQWGDGLFQTGLAGAVLFNPERAADPAAIAAGFTVLLLPYSVIGPFAGALLDRWDRRRVLVGANLLRGVLILLTALAVGTGLNGLPLFVGALVAVGVSRFVNSGLSASLPHVVDERHLVEGNALATTLGAVVSVLGAACAVVLRDLFGSDNAGSGWVTAVSVLGSVLGAAVAARFPRGRLGPDQVDENTDTVVAVARGLADGGRVALRTPSVAAGFVALFAHRAAFAASLLITVLLLRYSFHNWGPLRAGLSGLGEVAVAGGAGVLVAGLITARLVARFGRKGAICLALAVAAAAQAGLGLPMMLPPIMLAAFVITAAGQVVKLCVDSAAQQDVADETRGRVFALYDTLFNITQVVAVALVAAVVPFDGQARWLVVVATVVYLAGLSGYLLVLRSRHG